MDACACVGPAAFVLGKIGLPFLHVRFGNVTDEVLRTKHILVFLLQGFGIICEVEHQRAHQCVALISDGGGAGVDVGLQAFF